jgi:hypothetical protein
LAEVTWRYLKFVVYNAGFTRTLGQNGIGQRFFAMVFCVGVEYTLFRRVVHMDGYVSECMTNKIYFWLI